MIRRARSICFIVAFVLTSAVAFGQKPSFRVLAFYSTNIEPDHADFGRQAVSFFDDLAKKDNFEFKATTNWDDLNPDNLKQYQVVLWLNDSPSVPSQRAAFQQYMDNGGAWLGFHAGGYIDHSTTWPWFADFMTGYFVSNNWPPLPAKLVVDDRTHPATKRLPASFLSPANEWYSWQPNPRLNSHVKVLLTLDPSNYPLGFKDTLVGGDVPVVWSNTKYKMIYANMGHGDKVFTGREQNLLFEDLLLWLGGRSL